MPVAKQQYQYYQPPGPIADAFIRSPILFKALMGPVGSGKSTACCVSIVNDAHAQPASPLDGIRRSRVGVFRNTYVELKTTTIRTWHDWMPQSVGTWKAEGPPTHRLFFKLPDQTIVDLEVMFMALDRPDDVAKLLSLELTSAWMNEVRELPKQVFNTLRQRVNRYPQRRHGGAAWPGIRMDTNPPDDDSWFYKLFEEEKPPNHQLFRQPGAFTAGAENRQNLAPDYYENMLPGMPKHEKHVMVDANYGYSRAGEPVYGDDWDDSLHVAPGRIAPIPGRKIILGADAGRTPACIAGQRDAWGRWLILAELVAHGMGAERFGGRINAWLKENFPGHTEYEGWGDPAADYANDAGEMTWLEIVSNETEITFQPAPLSNNNINTRIEAVRQPLTELIGGQPAFQLGRNCPILRKGFNSGYRFRRLQVAGDKRFDDKPEKNAFSHPHDGLQYLIVGGGDMSELLGRDRGEMASRAQTQAADERNPYGAYAGVRGRRRGRQRIAL